MEMLNISLRLLKQFFQQIDATPIAHRDQAKKCIGLETEQGHSHTSLGVSFCFHSLSSAKQLPHSDLPPIQKEHPWGPLW